MNKIFACMLMCTIILTLALSGASAQEQLAESGTPQSLVVYFSWSGNTASVANEILTQTGADGFELIPVEPYSDDYNTLLDIAKAEQRNNARPEITGEIENFEDYSVVYVGYPNWWGDMPMLVYAFFDAYDFTGKTIAPFCTSASSGLSHTVESIRTLVPEAIVLDGLHVAGSSAENATSPVTEWLSGMSIPQ